MYTIDKNKYSNILLLFTFLFPTFPVITRTGSAGRLGEMALVAVIVGILLLFVFIYNLRIRTTPFLTGTFVASIFFVLISVSIINESDFITLRDMYEYHKPLLILLIFYFYCSIEWSGDTLSNNFIKPIRFLFVFFVIYGLIEAFTGPIGNVLSTLFYKNNRPILYNKSTGSFGITYFFATFMLLSFFFFFFLFVLKRKILDLALCFGSLFALLATQSRTLFIALGVGLLYVFFTYWIYKGFPFKKQLYIGVFVIILIVFFSWDYLMLWASRSFPYLYAGIDYLIKSGGVDAEGVGSANIRFQQLLWAWDNQSAIPIFGAGIGKGTGPQLESFYALYLYRYGLLGMFVAMVLMLYNFVLSIKCYRVARNNGELEGAAYFLAFSVFCFVLPISSLSSVITDQVRFAVLYYGTTAVMLQYRYLNLKL